MKIVKITALVAAVALLTNCGNSNSTQLGNSTQAQMVASLANVSDTSDVLSGRLNNTAPNFPDSNKQKMGQSLQTCTVTKGTMSVIIGGTGCPISLNASATESTNMISGSLNYSVVDPNYQGLNPVQALNASANLTYVSGAIHINLNGVLELVQQGNIAFNGSAYLSAPTSTNTFTGNAQFTAQSAVAQIAVAATFAGTVVNGSYNITSETCTINGQPATCTSTSVIHHMMGFN